MIMASCMVRILNISMDISGRHFGYNPKVHKDPYYNTPNNSCNYYNITYYFGSVFYCDKLFLNYYQSSSHTISDYHSTSSHWLNRLMILKCCWMTKKYTFWNQKSFLDLWYTNKYPKMKSCALSNVSNINCVVRHSTYSLWKCRSIF